MEKMRLTFFFFLISLCPCSWICKIRLSCLFFFLCALHVERCCCTRISFSRAVDQPDGRHQKQARLCILNRFMQSATYTERKGVFDWRYSTVTNSDDWRLRLFSVYVQTSEKNLCFKEITYCNRLTWTVLRAHIHNLTLMASLHYTVRVMLGFLFQKNRTRTDWESNLAYPKLTLTAIKCVLLWFVHD